MAAVVLKDKRRSAVAGQVPVAPGHQGEYDGVKVETRLRQVVLEPGRVTGVRHPLKHSGTYQHTQPRCQSVARNSGPPDHLVEPAVAEKDLPDGEQGAPASDDLKRAGDGALPRLGRCGRHVVQHTNYEGNLSRKSGRTKPVGLTM